MQRQKWLIVPTQAFSVGVKGKEHLIFDDLPWVVKMYLKFFKNKVHIVHDEISWIKTNVPMAEKKKSSRSRLIKLLEKYSESRCGMTGTLLSKSPVNIMDPYRFLSASFFEGENEYDIAETYSIMITLRAARGRRVLITQKEWDKIRKRLIRAYNLGGEVQLNSAKTRVHKEYGISYEECEHILTKRTFTPFINIDKLMKRVETVTMSVAREDIFDITNDKFVYNPIKRGVKLGPTGLQLGKELVKLGFTDKLTLGKAKALELIIRLQDICNGFEPIKSDADILQAELDAMDGKKPKIVVRYEPLPENPKLDMLEDLLDQVDVFKNQVVVWCSRRNAFMSIEQKLTQLGIPYVSYSGAQNGAEKKQAEILARDGTARVFLANPASASFGLNCLKAFNYMFWYSICSSVERYHQAQHRLLRGQSLTPKFAYEIFIKGSIEERIYRAVNAGIDLIGETNTKDMFEFAKAA